MPKVKDTATKVNETTYEVKTKEFKGTPVERDIEAEYGDRKSDRFEPKFKLKKMGKTVGIKFKTDKKVKKEKAKDLEIEYDNGMKFRMVAMKNAG